MVVSIAPPMSFEDASQCFLHQLLEDNLHMPVNDGAGRLVDMFELHLFANGLFLPLKGLIFPETKVSKMDGGSDYKEMKGWAKEHNRSFFVTFEIIGLGDQTIAWMPRDEISRGEGILLEYAHRPVGQMRPTDKNLIFYPEKNGDRQVGWFND